MSVLSWLVPSLFYLLAAAIVLRAIAVLVARRAANASEAEKEFSRLALLPLNTPAEASSTYKAALLVLKSGVARPVGILILVGALVWAAIIGLFMLGFLILLNG